MLVEPAILNREYRLDHAWRNRGERHLTTLFAFASGDGAEKRCLEREPFARIGPDQQLLDAVRRLREKPPRHAARGGRPRPARPSRAGPRPAVSPSAGRLP